jgi:hypothetical protein
MPRREIAPSPEPLPGESIELRDGDLRFTLFLPRAGKAGANGEVALAIHFHTTTWFAIEEHLRRGLAGPLIVANFGSGSAVYRVPFEDRQRLDRWLRLVEEELKKRGATRARIAAVDISSFSAGYGAVRELLKSPEHVALIRRIVLCDSLYGSLAPASDGGRKAASEHIEPWLPFATAAQRGEKTFVLTYSQVPTETYASTAECAAAILEALGLEQTAVEEGSTPASRDPDFPLRSRADSGNLHVWGYGGADAQAHITHVRHLADIWRALDAAGKP